MNYTISTLSIKGVSQKYFKEVWIDDEHHESGDQGYFKSVEKTYPEPRIRIYLELNVPKGGLEIGGVYGDDQGNTYIATDTSHLELRSDSITDWKMPISFMLVNKSI